MKRTSIFLILLDFSDIHKSKLNEMK